MTTVKTAISLDERLFRQAEDLARRMKLSRSGLCTAALEEFIERRRNQELLQAINLAYDEPADAAETRLQRAMRKRHRRAVRGQW